MTNYKATPQEMPKAKVLQANGNFLCDAIVDLAVQRCQDA